jgi:WD40 repeat protein
MGEIPSDVTGPGAGLSVRPDGLRHFTQPSSVLRCLAQRVCDVSWSRGGRALVASCSGGVLNLFEPVPTDMPRVIAVGERDPSRSLSTEPSTSRSVSRRGFRSKIYTFLRLRLTADSDRSRTHFPDEDPLGLAYRESVTAVTALGECIACGSGDGSVWLCNSAGELTRLGDHENAPIISVGLYGRGSLLVSSSGQHEHKVWNTVTRRLETSFLLNLGHRAGAASGNFVGSFRESSKGDPLAFIAQFEDDSSASLAIAEMPLITIKGRIPDSKDNRYRKIAGEDDPFTCCVWACRDQLVAVGTYAGPIRIFDVVSCRETRVLEGHTQAVAGLFEMPEFGVLGSWSRDGTIRLWSTGTWQQIAVVKEPDINGVAPHPSNPLIASWGADDCIQLWALELDTSNITGQQYANAKVVLLGDTGVGKSGLALVLSGQPFAPTDSTHGRHIWTFDQQVRALSNGGRELREILLWDLAGQPGYRLIHQLHLNEIAVALVVFDARNEADAFSGVEHWSRALRQAVRNQGPGCVRPMKFLVAARTDRGGITVSDERIRTFMREHDFADFFRTSAREGWQIAALKVAVAQAIRWEELPKVSSNELFQEIKDFLVAEKKEGRILATADELFGAYLRKANLRSADDLRDAFQHCINRIENRGLIRRLKFGGLVLLQPELLDAYASAIIDAAREEPGGLGFIEEEAALAGHFPMSGDERVGDRSQERLLLIATVEELLRHEIALRELTEEVIDLVFPSQFRREHPEMPDVPGKTVVFRFEGAVMSVYATMAVRLSHSRIFKKKEMWKDGAVFTATVGGDCGLVLRELREGQGELTLFFDDQASEQTRFQFEDYVFAHLRRRAVTETVQRRRIFVCQQHGCKTPISEQQVRGRRERGYNYINCPVCGTRLSLQDRTERLQEPVESAVEEIDRNADFSREQNSVTAIIKGKREAKDFDVFLCHNSRHKLQVRQIADQLLARGFLPWLDERELRPGLTWQKALQDQIRTIKAAAVFIGPGGTGRWQQLEQQAFLEKFVKQGKPIVPVILPGLKSEPRLPPFLQQFGRVDLRIEDPDPLDGLIWGITGERPLSW